MGKESIPQLSFVRDSIDLCWDQLANVWKMSEQFPAAYDAAQDAIKRETIFYTIRSAKGTNFTAALVQNAKIDAVLSGLASNKIRIKRVKLQSIQNLDWQFYYWKTVGTDDTDLDLDSWCGRTTFDLAQGEQIAGAFQYYYDSGMTDTIYEDLGGLFTLNVSLVNRSATAKILTTGYVIGEWEYEVAA